MNASITRLHDVLEVFYYLAIINEKARPRFPKPFSLLATWAVQSSSHFERSGAIEMTRFQIA